MRVNVLLLAALVLLVALQRATIPDYLGAVAGVAVAAFLAVSHFIRQRRFKLYDEAKKARRSVFTDA